MDVPSVCIFLKVPNLPILRTWSYVISSYLPTTTMFSGLWRPVATNLVVSVPYRNLGAELRSHLGRDTMDHMYRLLS